MAPPWKWLLPSIIAILAVEPLGAQQTGGGSSPTPAASPLSEAELKAAVTIDSLTVPTPGEFFKAIDKTGKPNWVSQFRPPTPIGGVNRAQMALNLGTLIADGYIAVEAQDGQQVAVARRAETYDDIVSLDDPPLPPREPPSPRVAEPSPE